MTFRLMAIKILLKALSCENSKLCLVTEFPIKVFPEISSNGISNGTKNTVWWNLKIIPTGYWTSSLVPRLFLWSLGMRLLDLTMTFSCSQSIYKLAAPPNLGVGVPLKWFVSQTPYLVHESTIAPHITGSRVLLEIESLCWHKDREKFVLLMLMTHSNTLWPSSHLYQQPPP